jgi:hypothetical protein
MTLSSSLKTSSPSRGQKWSTFIRNHLDQTWAADWFTIVTARFEILYGFVILNRWIVL